MKSLLFVDMLGVKNRWKTQGKTGAQTAFKKLRALVSKSLNWIPPIVPVKGFLEADAAALVFDDVVVACEFGRRLYLNAFFESKNDTDERVWFRGAIVPCSNTETLRIESKLDGSVTQSNYSDQLLEAIQVEKSGFKGMRIVIANSLVTKSVQQALTRTIDGKTLIPLKKLTYTPLPTHGKVSANYQDFLWMASGDTTQWKNAHATMVNRLRWCSPEMGEEFTHAAATQVVFNECAAILKSLS